MFSAPSKLIRLTAVAVCPLLAVGALAVAEPASSQSSKANEVMQSVFANRLRDGGFWRQNNPDFAGEAHLPAYWMQVWRNGPGGEVVIADAIEVKGDGTCSPLIHLVFRYDPESDRIVSAAFGAGGLSGSGVMTYSGSQTSNEATLNLPGGGEMRMRDHEDHGAGDSVTVNVEIWDGETWTPGDPVTWHRSASGPGCSGSAGS